MNVLDAAGLGLLTALATGVGVLPVYLFTVGERGLGFLWGVSAGLMAAISVLDLIVPAIGTPTPLVVGALAGVGFVLVASKLLHAHNDAHEAHGHVHRIGQDPISGLTLLMFLVFTVHSAPEGVGIGSALQAGTITGLIVVLAIAIHNVPEGTAVGVGLRSDGVPLGRAALYAIVTSLPQPLLAPLVFVVAVGPFLPAGMGFAGGAMLALVAQEVVPEGLAEDRGAFIIGAEVGLAVGLVLNIVLPVPGI